eukprot:g19030.t1
MKQISATKICWCVAIKCNKKICDTSQKVNIFP